MRLWLRQLYGEWLKLRGQRVAGWGFAACLAVEVLFVLLFKLPAVRALAQADFRRGQLVFSEAFSGLTVAAHLIGEASMLAGGPFIALVAADLIAGEVDRGTLRLVLARPQSRDRVWGQRLLVAVAYTFGIGVFIAVSSLVVGLAFEGPGRLVMMMKTENVFGDFAFAEGLRRYFLASALLAVSLLTIGLLAFAFSCSRMKPVTAAVLALTITIFDAGLRQLPAFASVKHHFLMEKRIAWLHVFDDTIPWALIRADYRVLLALDTALILASLASFRRLQLKG